MSAATVPATPAAAPRSLSREVLRSRPVSGRELPLRDDESIVSTTDTRGIITYVNGYFVEVSGYAESELIGQPHNLIRHPDMPAAAFADMWAHLKQGRPWVGMVKNRCKNGDHYWVEANVTPIREGGGSVIGYMSVRRKPDRGQVDAAERDYAALREGRLRGIEIRDARVQRRPLGERLNPLWRLGLRARLQLLALFAPALALAALLLPPATPVPLALPALLGGGALWAIYAAWWLGRDVVGRLAGADAALRAMAGDDFRGRIAIHRDDEIGRVLQGIKSMQIRLGFQVEQMRREGAAARRINQALDVAATNVMVADAQLVVVFANQALLATFRAAEARIARAPARHAGRAAPPACGAHRAGRPGVRPAGHPGARRTGSADRLRRRVEGPHA
jgi:methyl-accepting chemotaxis protein